MRGLGSIPTGGNIFSKFYNPNLHNIARSDSLGFKTKNPNGKRQVCNELSQDGDPIS